MSFDGLWVPAEPASSSTTLDDLTDVATTGATDGQALVYDVESNTWVPGDMAAGNGERRYAAAGSYIYLGTAPAGTLDSAKTWTLTRLTLAADGSVSATETATDAWDDRATATYS